METKSHCWLPEAQNTLQTAKLAPSTLLRRAIQPNSFFTLIQKTPYDQNRKSPLI